MKKIGEYKNYLLYHEEEQDRDINNSSGSRYIRNTILVFLPNETKPEIGRQICCCDNEEEAKAHIDDLTKEPIKNVMENALKRSKEQSQCSREQSNEIENERRRKEKIQATYELENTNQ